MQETITIQMEVDQATVNKMGVAAIKQRLQRYIELEELAMLAQEIDRNLKEAGLDFDELAEQARQKAWDEFKVKHPNLFPQ